MLFVLSMVTDAMWNFSRSFETKMPLALEIRGLTSFEYVQITRLYLGSMN